MRKHILLATVAAIALAPAAMAQTQTEQGEQGEQTQQTQTETQTTTGAGAQVETAQDFVTRAGMSDLFEIEAARLASENAENDEVRQFAERLMEDHRQAASDLADAANEAGVDVAILDALDMPPATGTTGTGGSTGGAATGTTDPGQTGATTDQATGSGTAGQTTQAPTTTGQAAADGLDQEHRTKLDDLRSASGAEFDRMFLQMQIEAHEDAIAMFEHYSEQGDEQALQQHAEQALPELRAHLEEAERLMQ